MKQELVEEKELSEEVEILKDYTRRGGVVLRDFRKRVCNYRKNMDVESTLIWLLTLKETLENLELTKSFLEGNIVKNPQTERRYNFKFSGVLMKHLLREVNRAKLFNSNSIEYRLKRFQMLNIIRKLENEIYDETKFVEDYQAKNMKDIIEIKIKNQPYELEAFTVTRLKIILPEEIDAREFRLKEAKIAKIRLVEVDSELKNLSDFMVSQNADKDSLLKKSAALKSERDKLEIKLSS